MSMVCYSSIKNKEIGVLKEEVSPQNVQLKKVTIKTDKAEVKK